MSSTAPLRRNLLLRQVGQTLVMVQNASPPTDEEWNEFLKLVAPDPAGLRLMVVTDGGAPTAGQRRALQAALNGAMPLVAAVSDNMKVRFVAATIALFHSTHGSFTRKEMDKAHDHLKLSLQERKAVDSAVRELQKTLG